MGFADYVLPHRLLLNRALNKEADKLRERVSTYQKEYKNKIAQINEEIEVAIAAANGEIEKAKESIIAQLSQDQNLLNAVQGYLFDYTDVYFQQRLSKKRLKLLNLEQQTISENISFLSGQMKLIGEEIEILEDRKNRLSSQTDIKDVVALLSVSDCDLPINDDETAQTLLGKVLKVASESEKGSAKRTALFKLAEKLQERAELLPLITYISWVIQQKIQFSKDLTRQRDQLRNEENEKQAEINDIQGAIKQFNERLTETARHVREYWVAPIAELGVEIAAYYHQKKQLPKYSERAAELKEYCEKHKEVSRRLKNMAESHSDDSFTWDSLQRERKDLSEKIEDAKSDLGIIESLESSIDSAKKKRSEWHDKRKSILGICNQSNVYLLSDRDSGESDEIRIISERLDGYLQRQTEIEKENRAALERIQKEKDDCISKLEEAICEANASAEEAQNAYDNAQSSLVHLQESDNRFFLVKLFKESDDVTKAKKQLLAKKKALKSAQDLLSGLLSEKEKEEKAFNKEIKSFRGIRDSGLVSSIEKYQRRLGELTVSKGFAMASEEMNDET